MSTEKSTLASEGNPITKPDNPPWIRRWALLFALIASSALAFAWPDVAATFGLSKLESTESAPALKNAGDIDVDEETQRRDIADSPKERLWDPFTLPKWGLRWLVILTMFCLGMAIQLAELRELRQHPVAVFLGVAVQCIWMPLLAWVAIRVLGLSGPIASGVVLVGCVPGAMASNVLTMTARGNVSYSISLTTMATLLSPISVPLALSIIGHFDEQHSLPNPWQQATTLLSTVVLPVVLGFAAQQFIQHRWRWFVGLAPWVASVALLWIIASVVAGNRDQLGLINLSLLGALLVINLAGYIGGGLAAKATGLPSSMGRALSLEVGMQNAGLGTFLAANMFGADSPALIPTAAYTFGCMLTGTLLASYWGSRHVASTAKAD
ncbi:MAG: bile acid:sodium symporter family protein [Planctomycetota bacterium]